MNIKGIPHRNRAAKPLQEKCANYCLGRLFCGGDNRDCYKVRIDVQATGSFPEKLHTFLSYDLRRRQADQDDKHYPNFKRESDAEQVNMIAR